MARTGISYDEVKLAIDEMLAEGLNPTIAGLREKLGTGSFTTISEHLKRWRGERQEKPVAATGTPTPETLSGMMQSLWQQAREEANKELQQYKDKIDEEIKAALNEKDLAISQAEEVEKKNSWLEDKNTELQNRIAEADRLVGQLQEQNKALTEEIELSGKQLDAVKQTAKEQHDRILDEKSVIAKNLDQQKDRVLELSKEFQQQLKEERKRTEQSEQHWLTQLDSERQKNKQLTDALSNNKDNLQMISALKEQLTQQEKNLLRETQQAQASSVETCKNLLTEMNHQIKEETKMASAEQQGNAYRLETQIRLIQEYLNKKNGLSLLQDTRSE